MLIKELEKRTSNIEHTKKNSVLLSVNTHQDEIKRVKLKQN